MKDGRLLPTYDGIPEPVYNIEVDGDHCYRVGEQGLLVHNASCDESVLCQPACALFKPTFADERDSRDSSNMPKDGKLYLTFDGYGRATGIRARLCAANATGGQPAGGDAAGWKDALRNIFPGRSHLNVIEQLHLLARVLGGSGGPRNLVVSCARSTNAKMKRLEGIVRKFIDANPDIPVDYEVRVEYESGTTNPYPKAIYLRAAHIDPASLKTNMVGCWEDNIDWLNPIKGETNLKNCPGALP